ncbi:MAG: LamG-like jellyroll fold domain-containing protein, partial [Planctomycetota bacterium]
PLRRRIVVQVCVPDIEQRQNTDLIRAAGTAAAGLTTLAERVGTDHRVLTLLDVGDTDLDDNPSPQRRVVLPWGGGSFEIGDLNTDGLTLLRQALEWAAAGEPYTVTTPAPIARWSFEETSGTTAADSVGDHDGFYRSGVVLGAEGRSGYAAEFDGASHYVEIPHDDEFLLDQGALSVWFYLDDVSGRKELVSKDSSGYDTGGQFTMYVNNAALYIRFSSTTSHYSMSHGTLSPQTWHHVAFTFGPGGMRFYLDGALVDSDPYTGGWGSTSGGAGNFEPMAFGANTWSSGNGVVTPLKNYLDGRLDEVGIYDQQLSDAEVLALFQQAPVAAEAEASEVPQLQVLYEFIEPTPTVPTPVAHWRLDETQANTLYTETGGTVVIEAERYTRRVAGANGGANMTWYLATGDDASDGLMLKAGPDGGSGVSVLTDGPRVDYDIVFNTPGTYRLWARLRADDSGDDEVHVGFEGVALSDSPGAGLTVPTFDTWHWIDDVDGGPSDLTVSVPTPGTYTLNFWMIENGMTIDKIVLSTDPTAPTGLGPTANGRTGEVENQHSSQTGSFRDGATPGAGGMGDGGTSVQLDGVDDYVEFPHEDAHLIDEGTVSFWFYADRVAGTQTLISKDADNNRAGHMRIYLNQFGGLGARLQNESSSSYSISVPNGSISTGRWYHVALAFGTDGMSLYLDGVRNDTDAYTGGLGASGGDPLGNREHWTFGIDHWDSRATELNSLVFPFMGRIDDVRLYDQNLSETQIAAIVALSDPGAEASATVQDTAGVAPPLDLTIADPDHVTWVSGGGLTIDTETLITSGAAPRLHDAITETDQITVEAEYTPAALDRNEITRVFCYEDLHHLRNFSVTHRLERHRAILRTDFTMSGGESEQSAPLLAVGERAHVIMTYDGSELTVYVNGTAVINTPLTGDLDTWDDSYILSMANAVPGGRPFFGTLHRMAIWDKAVNAVQAENLFNGNPPGEPDGGEDGLDYEVEWLESP